MSDDIEILRPDWPAPAGVRAVFTLRSGGLSRPPFDTLNLGLRTGDDPRAVVENRRRVQEALRLPSEPTWLTQVHGAVVARLTRAAAPDSTEIEREPPCADAAVTRTPGRVCAVQVADCMPVLFAARDGSAIGAAHAGWRGLAAGVLEATVRALAEAPFHVTPDGLIAWMGPAIGPEHFEVGEEVRAAFLASDAQAGSAFARNIRGRWQCDLSALARRRLAASGVRGVYGGGWCTYSDGARFFSYRRNGQCGRMAALIWVAHKDDRGSGPVAPGNG